MVVLGIGAPLLIDLFAWFLSLFAPIFIVLLSASDVVPFSLSLGSKYRSSSEVYPLGVWLDSCTAFVSAFVSAPVLPLMLNDGSAFVFVTEVPLLNQRSPVGLLCIMILRRCVYHLRLLYFHIVELIRL